MCSEIYFCASPIYMFRAVHTSIIRSTILTVSTAIGTIHSRSQIVSVTSSQLRCEEVHLCTKMMRVHTNIKYVDDRLYTPTMDA